MTTLKDNMFNGALDLLKSAVVSRNSHRRYWPAQAARSSLNEVFAGQTAVVTGASSGIGKAIAMELAARGAGLCLVGRRQRALEEVAQTVRARKVRPLIYRADLSAVEQIEEFAKSFTRDFGRIDMLIHGAGRIALGSTEDSSVEELDRQFSTNVRAPYILTKALLPMLRSTQGQIVFINSTAGLTAGANSGQYAATKHALRAIADSLRQEINPDGIRVLSVFVGRTATPMQAAVHAAEGRPYVPEKLIQPEDVASVVIHALSLPKTAEVTAIHLRPLTKLD